ncbi:MAG: 3-phosphoshikimate 1-carboxyvinyltransferase [Clostridia bacterium]|nr:3-phosphoshikimate 1-carboxyvinyltransferase [Clostridia bacterium]
MNAIFRPAVLAGTIDAPPSKSMAHRYLIGAALSGQVCRLTGMAYSQDILATIDCLRALGASVVMSGDTVTVDPHGFMQAANPVLDCRESGSTLRFFIPLALCLGRTVILRGSRRLLSRPLDVYEDICHEYGFTFQNNGESLTLCGRLTADTYRVRGDVSSQFITGLILALVYRGQEATVEILPPFASRPYVELTLDALADFGAHVSFADAHTIRIQAAPLHAFNGRMEGDYSNAAFLDAFNYIGSSVTVGNLNPASRQGDRVYSRYFEQIAAGSPTLDITDCPDLGPVLFALAALKNGATFIGTDRLRDKESDRGAAMDAELRKLGGGLIFGDNTVTVPPQTLRYGGEVLDGHNDHRIVMALSVILSAIGGSIHGVEAVRKSYPAFFDDIQRLGAKVEWI